MNDYLNTFNEIKNEIDSFPLEIDKGTKKMIAKYHQNQILERNKLVEKYIKKYSKLEEEVLAELNVRKEALLPRKEIDEESLFEANNDILNVLLYTNINNTNDKLKISFYLNELVLSSNDLSKFNSNIGKLIDIFKNADVNLTIEDFKYSLFTYNYMDAYLNNIKSDKFESIIKTCFDTVYWSCPNLINHIKLNFYILSIKYKKKLDLYSKSLENTLMENNNLTGKNIEDEYKYLITSTDNLLNNDEYYLSYPFLSNTSNPDDYLKESNNRKNKEFKLSLKELSDKDDIDKYYTNVENLYHVCNELKDYIFFKPFIDDINKRITSFDKNSLKLKEKEFNKSNSELNKINSKIFKLVNKNKTIDQKEIVKTNELVNSINTIYEEMIDLRTTYRLNNNLNNVSNVKDALKAFLIDYNYFVYMYNKINDEELKLSIYELYDKLKAYIFNPYNMFIENVTINPIDDIYTVISNKFRLLNININSELLGESLVELINDTHYIVTICNAEKIGLDFKTYSNINKIKKITG